MQIVDLFSRNTKSLGEEVWMLSVTVTKSRAMAKDIGQDVILFSWRGVLHLLYLHLVDIAAFKSQLKKYGESLIEQRIAAARLAMDNAQLAANAEGKSSAGDKYETARAMSHLEKDMHGRQLMNHLKELAALRAVKADSIYTSVQTGAFIQCAGLSFFICAGLGQQFLEGMPVIFVSPSSPLAKSMAGKRKGDIVIFKYDREILEVY